MTSRLWPVWWAAAGFFTVLCACVIARDVRDIRTAELAAKAAPMAVAVAALPPVVEQAVVIPAPRPMDHYDELRSSLRFVETRFHGGDFITPDYETRMALVKSAAQRAGLHEVGLNYRDVYGIIAAETSWVPRLGRSKDGTPNLGVAQFEPATARALGLRNPNDLVEAVHVAAVHMKEAAQWSSERISGLRLSPAERALRLREGVSVYYNLSSRGRAAWNGMNAYRLPIETQRHIINARMGAQEAAALEGQMLATKYKPDPALVLRTSTSPGA